MEFITPITITPLTPTITYGDGILFMGSCFADEVGGICRGLGFDALVNPFGALYNPVSIANAISRLRNGKPFTHKDVVQVGEEFLCTFSHNTEFWRHTETELLEDVNKALRVASEHFARSKWIVLSLGTAWVYRECQTLEVVANCHKMPSQCFDRVRLTVPQILTVLSDLVNSYPDKQFIFTVSPLRHLKDGLHENQVSKASLLLAENEICERFENAHYFPAYEILLDELRNYRFYKEDMVHPTDQAVRYIWEKFVDFAVDPQEQHAMKAAEELRQMLHHKPLFPDSEAFRKFEQQRENKIKEFSQAYPNILIELLSES